MQLRAGGEGQEFTRLGSSCLPFMSGFQGAGAALPSRGINGGECVSMSDRDCNLYHWEHNCEPGVYMHVPDWVMFITLK